MMRGVDCYIVAAPASHVHGMRKLDRLDAWRVAQEVAHKAYLLTLDHRLAKHFALIDQIRRAALSIPANIAEGYSLGTTPQFIRGLDLVARPDVRAVLELSSRSIALIIGLIRTLIRRVRLGQQPLHR